MDDTLGSLKKELNGKVYYLGQMGSYVLIPVGKVIVVAMVSELKKLDVSINGEWKQRVLLTVTLVGTVKAGRYERGVSILPPIDTPVFFAEGLRNFIFTVSPGFNNRSFGNLYELAEKTYCESFNKKDTFPSFPFFL